MARPARGVTRLYASASIARLERGLLEAEAGPECRARCEDHCRAQGGRLARTRDLGV